MSSSINRDLGPRVTDNDSSTLRLCSLNPLSLIGVALMVTGICSLALIKTSILECGRPLRSPSHKGLQCRKKEVIFFGIDVNQTTFATPESNFNTSVHPVEKISLIVRNEPDLYKTTYWLKASNLDGSQTLEFPVGNHRPKAETIVAFLQGNILSPPTTSIIIADRMATTAFRLKQKLEASVATPQILTTSMPWASYLPGFLLILGGIIYAQRPGSRITLSKIEGKVKIKRHDLLPAIEFPLETVQSVVIEEREFTEMDDTGDSRPTHIAYRISLVLKSGEVQPFLKTYSANLKNKQKTVEIIRDFLQLSPASKID